MTGFNAKAPPPKTAAFLEIVDANRAPEDSELMDALGLPRGFAIYDQSDQLGAVREAMRAIHDGDRRYDAKAILTLASGRNNRWRDDDDQVRSLIAAGLRFKEIAKDRYLRNPGDSVVVER